MLVEFAHFNLFFSFFISLLLIFVPMFGVYFHNIAMMSFSRLLAFILYFSISLSFILLIFAFLQDDFSVRIVAEHSNIELPLLYKISAIWGGHEGSLLLWIQILSFWMLIISFFSSNIPLDIISRVLSVMGIIIFCFIKLLQAYIEVHYVKKYNHTIKEHVGEFVVPKYVFDCEV